MNRALQIFNANPAKYELELRKRISLEEFRGVHATMLANTPPEHQRLTTTINALTSAGGGVNYIRELTFVDGVKTGEKQLTKRRVAEANLRNGLKLVLSEEGEKAQAVSTNAVVRLKVRASFQYNPRWRCDMTIVRQMQLTEKLQTIKDSMFLPGLTIVNMVESAKGNSYELEFEYVSAATVTKNEVFDLAREVGDMVTASGNGPDDNAYLHALWLIAKATNIKYHAPPTLKTVTNQALSLSKRVYYEEVYSAGKAYLATEKSDGYRVVVLADAKTFAVINSRAETSVYAAPYAIPGQPLHILDCELVDGNKIYIFDVVRLDGKNLASQLTASRTAKLNLAANKMNSIAKEVAPAASATYTFIPKKYYKYVQPASNLKSIVKKIWNNPDNKKENIVLDGIMFTSSNTPYNFTKNYKWKPYEQNSIDFMAIKCPQQLAGRHPFVAEREEDAGKHLYLLFVGIDSRTQAALGLRTVNITGPLFTGGNTAYRPIQFAPSVQPREYLYWSDRDDLDGKVIELTKDDDCNWVFLRERTDRTPGDGYYGNDFRVAESIYMNYVDRFTLKDLYEKSSSYFDAEVPAMYRAANRHKRKEITDAFESTLGGMQRVIDLAAGRGADLGRYAAAKVREVLFIDRDRTAISELISRKFELVRKRQQRRHLTVMAMVADLSVNAGTHGALAKRIHDRFGFSQANGVVCNFALHYFCDSEKNLVNILTLVANALNKGGKFLTTIMDGRAVFDLLKKHKGEYIAGVADDIKYHIKARYSGTRLAPYGQAIAVKLPFSDDELVEEYLCNVTNLKRLARKCKLKCVSEKFMSAATGLSEADNENIQLHKIITFEKC